MRLEDKMKKYETIKRDNCERCGNPWFFDKGHTVECTTCHYDFVKYPVQIDKLGAIQDANEVEL